jgi:hypothetical protein
LKVACPPSGFVKTNVVETPFGTKVFRDLPPRILTFVALFHTTLVQGVPSMATWMPLCRLPPVTLMPKGVSFFMAPMTGGGTMTTSD